VSEDDTSEGEDWFEKALEEDDETEDGTATDESGQEREVDEWSDQDEEAGDWADQDEEASDWADQDEEVGDWTESVDASDAGGAFGDADEGGESPFGDDGDATPFDSGGEGGAVEDEGGLFDDDFGSAFESGGGEFDDEEFESSLPRIDLGIAGLDQMIQGGIPERHLIVAIGAAGSGKTTFGLQFLYHGLQRGEKGVFITLEQSRETILDTANERGWNFDHYEQEDELAVVDLDPVEMANSLDNIRGELPELIRDFDADRLVLDSVSLLEMMYEDQARRRTEVFDFTRSLKQAGVTTFLTSEANESNPYASRHGIIEYLTDAVFILKYVRGETQETRLAVEIQKIRNANHSRELKPYEITLEGISVYQQANIF
jgi:circadian clock protein KaiC